MEVKKVNRKNSSVMICCLFLFMMLLKSGYYGYRYYPVIDDWIQYGVYPLYENIFRDVIVRIGTCAARPLAGLADPYVWGKFWGNMGVAYFIITVLLIISGWLLYQVFEYNRLPVSLPFLIIFGLLPLGSEATYWISASSRLVVGLFFMSMSLYLLSIYIHKKTGHQKALLALFTVFNAVSLGFYEQIIVLGGFCTLLIIAANWRFIKNKWIAMIPAVNLGLIVLYYMYFGKTGRFADRGSMIQPGQNLYEHARLVLDQIAVLWGQAHLPLYSRGFARGVEILWTNHSYLYMSLILVCGFLTGVLVFTDKQASSLKNIFTKVVLGFVLFWVPYAPYFILQETWISHRNAFPSFIGLGLIIEALADLMCRNNFTQYVKGVCFSMVVVVFLTIHVSELTDYKNISMADEQICSNIVHTVRDEGFYNGSKKAVVFNAAPFYTEQNYYYHEHIHNVTSSDWALTGGVRAAAQNTEIKYILPVENKKPTDLPVEIWNSYILLGIDEKLNVTELKAVYVGNNVIKLFDKNNKKFGEVHGAGAGKYVFSRE